MKHTRSWAIAEFRTLLSSGELTLEELTKRIPAHSAASIDAIGDAVHAYHRGNDYSELNATMLGVLKRAATNRTCPVCHTRF